MSLQDKARSSGVKKQSRRTYLKSIAGTGIGWLSWERAFSTSSNERKIATHYIGNSVYKYATVPEDWYTQKSRAEQVKERLFDKYYGVDGVLGVGLAPSSAGIAGLRYMEVEVHILEDSTVDEKIPEQVDGIPVSVLRRERAQDLSAATQPNSQSTICYNKDYDPIPGGAKIESSYKEVYGTAMCRVEFNSSKYLMTARHLFVDDPTTDTDSCSTDRAALGTDVTQNGDYFGTVYEAFPGYDAALVELDPNGSRSGYSDGIVDQTGDVTGHVSKNGVDRMISNDPSETLQKRGATTCANSGELQRRISEYCTTSLNREALVESDIKSEGGDSGAPIYDVDEFEGTKYIFIVHIGTQSLYGDSLTQGTAAYRMNNADGITFG